MTRETAQTWKEAHGVESIVDFVQLEDDNVRSALLQSLSPTQVSDIARFCNSYPSIEVAFDLPGLEPIEAADDALEYRVRIESQTSVKVVAQVARDNVDEDSDEVYGKVVSSRYPHAKQEEWWLLVGDPAQNVLYGIKRFTLARRAQVKLEFELPNDLSTIDALQLKLYLMCDSYVGCDQEYDFTLRLD